MGVGLSDPGTIQEAYTWTTQLLRQVIEEKITVAALVTTALGLAGKVTWTITRRSLARRMARQSPHQARRLAPLLGIAPDQLPPDDDALTRARVRAVVLALADVMTSIRPHPMQKSLTGLGRALRGLSKRIARMDNAALGHFRAVDVIYAQTLSSLDPDHPTRMAHPDPDGEAERLVALNETLDHCLSHGAVPRRAAQSVGTVMPIVLEHLSSPAVDWWGRLSTRYLELLRESRDTHDRHHRARADLRSGGRTFTACSPARNAKDILGPTRATFVGREWFFDELQSFLGASDTRRVALVESGYGCGKTTLMRECLSRWGRTGERNPKVIAAHFFRALTPASCTRAELLTRLLRQARHTVPEMVPHLPSREEADLLALLERDPATFMRDCLVGPLRAAFDAHPAERPWVIVLDAIDEMASVAGGLIEQSAVEVAIADEDDEFSALVALLKDLIAGLPPNVKLIVTSRPIELGWFLGAHKVIRLEADGQAGIGQDDRYADDLLRCAQARCATAKISEKLAQKGWDAQRLCDFLVTHAGGKMLYVESVLDRIEHDDDRIRDIGDLPRGMREFYWSVFKAPPFDTLESPKAMRGSSLARLAVHLLATLAWLREDRVPLPELRRLLSPELGAAEDAQLRAACLLLRGLVSLSGTQATGQVAFNHLSFREFVETELAVRPGQLQRRPGNAGFLTETVYPFAARQLIRHVRLHDAATLGNDWRYPDDWLGRYTARQGVKRLVEIDQYAAAVGLICHLKAHVPSGAVPLALLAKELASGLHHAVTRLDAESGDSDPARESSQPHFVPWDPACVTQDLDPALLPEVLEMGYETGLFTSSLRLLIEYYPDRGWVPLRARRLATPEDIVFRYDSGKALARLAISRLGGWGPNPWLNRVLEMATEGLDAIEASPPILDGDSGYNREMAGYALAEILTEVMARCETSPEAARTRDQIHRTLGRLAASPLISDRMVVGEIVLAQGFDTGQPAHWIESERFWQPAWSYLRCDLLDLAGFDALPPVAQRYLRGFPDEVREAEVVRQRADALRAELVAHPAFQPGGMLHSIAELTLDPQRQYRYAEDEGHRAQIVHALDTAVQRSQDGARLAQNILTLLALHPLWSMTELAASMLGQLASRPSVATQAHAWLRSFGADGCWRLRYAAVDAAFNLGQHDPTFAVFREQLLACGRFPHGRVQGIVADDFLGWLRVLGDAERVDVLSDPDIRGLLGDWLATADDSWLLEYLHHFLRFVQRDITPTHPDLHAQSFLLLAPGGPSKFFRTEPGKPPVYELGHHTFLLHMEAVRAGTTEAGG